MLTPREAFRAGFLLRALRSPRVKRAFIGSGVTDAADVALLALLGLPPLAGAGIGWALGRGANEMSDIDEEELRQRELQREYARMTERLKRSGRTIRGLPSA